MIVKYFKGIIEDENISKMELVDVTNEINTKENKMLELNNKLMKLEKQVNVNEKILISRKEVAEILQYRHTNCITNLCNGENPILIEGTHYKWIGGKRMFYKKEIEKLRN